MILMSMAYHRSVMADLLREAETQREIRRIMRDRGEPALEQVADLACGPHCRPPDLVRG